MSCSGFRTSWAVDNPIPRAAVKLTSGSVIVRVGISQLSILLGNSLLNVMTAFVKKLSFFKWEVRRIELALSGIWFLIIVGNAEAWTSIVRSFSVSVGIARPSSLIFRAACLRGSNVSCPI